MYQPIIPGEAKARNSMIRLKRDRAGVSIDENDVMVGNLGDDIHKLRLRRTPSPPAPKPPMPPQAKTTTKNETVFPSEKGMVKRLNLFLHVRVLLKILEREGDHATRAEVQRAMHYCQRRNGEGDPAFQSLAGSIERMLRAIVGEQRWHQAEACCAVVLSKKVQGEGSAAAIRRKRQARPA